MLIVRCMETLGLRRSAPREAEGRSPSSCVVRAALRLGTRLGLVVLLALMAGLAANGSAGAATTFCLLYQFKSAPDGADPQANLIFDAGNLYGALRANGANGTGAVVELIPSASRNCPWQEFLYSFGVTDDGAGGDPLGGFVSDAAGNLYSTTQGGGAKGGGTVFELSPPKTKGGAWVETTLWSFLSLSGSDGAFPYAGLVFDAAGNLYGTTFSGGAHGDGTVFELSPPNTKGGAWAETVLWSFGGSGDGINPRAALIFDAAGNLFGTTQEGGDSRNDGVVFELSPPKTQGGAWNEKVLWKFGGSGDGVTPYAGLVSDAVGNFYGATSAGGGKGAGAVFELSPPKTAGGAWSETVLWSFGAVGDGANPYAGLVFDAAGNLYGATFGGGSIGHGAVFELSRPKSKAAAWTESLLHSFQITDGSGPQGGLIFDASGVIYGTTLTGGSTNNGAVFQLGGAAFGLTVGVTGKGSVTSSQQLGTTGISCPDACNAVYAAGSQVTLTAKADGSTFLGWSGAGTGVGACSLTMNNSQSVTANFSEVHSLVVFLAGNGSGAVTSAPSGINCQGSDSICSESFPAGTKLTLTATPGSGAIWSGWSGACSGAGTTCQMTMSMGRSVTATFFKAAYPLSVAMAGGADGMVTSQPAGITCPGACTASFPSGTQVTLTASPNPGFVFDGWTGNGACGGRGKCKVTMHSAESVKTTFSPIPPLARPDGYAAAPPS